MERVRPTCPPSCVPALCLISPHVPGCEAQTPGHRLCLGLLPSCPLTSGVNSVNWSLDLTPLHDGATPLAHASPSMLSFLSCPHLFSRLRPERLSCPMSSLRPSWFLVTCISVIWSLMSSLLIRHPSGGQAQCLPEHHYTASSDDKGQRAKDWFRRSTCMLTLFCPSSTGRPSSKMYNLLDRNISVERRGLCPSMGSGEICRVNPVRALEVGRSCPLLPLVTLTQRLTGRTLEKIQTSWQGRNTGRSHSVCSSRTCPVPSLSLDGSGRQECFWGWGWAIVFRGPPLLAHILPSGPVSQRFHRTISWEPGLSYIQITTEID